MRLRWYVRSGVIATAMLFVVSACSGKSVSNTANTTPAGGNTTQTTASAIAEKCKSVALTAAETGVTPTNITVTVMADTGSPIRPALFQGSIDAVKAWADYENDVNGGVGCRKVVVNTYDSKLSQTEAKNGVLTACGNSVAMVGTTALFFKDINVLEGCKDKAGAATGLPDFAELQTESTQQCSDRSYAVLPATGSCPYSGTGNRTFTIGATETDYLVNHYGPNLHGVFVVPTDLNSTIEATTPIYRAEAQLGIKNDKEFGESGLASQPQYTPVAQAMKQTNANYARNGLDYKGTVLMRKEAQAQGVTSVKVWDCSVQCYDKRLISEGGSATDKQWVWLNALPLEDESANPMLGNLFTYEQKNGKTPDGFGEQAWADGLLFADAVNSVVADKGPNAITRANILAAVRNIHDFTAGGLLAGVDVGGKKGSPCLVGMQVQGGKFVRVDPPEPGKFDCDNNKTVTLTIDPLKEFKG